MVRSSMPSAPKASLWRLAGYARPYWPVLAVAALASCVVAGATAAYAWIIGPLLEALLTGRELSVWGVRAEGAWLLILLPVLLVGVAVVKAVSQLLGGGLMFSAAQRVVADLRAELYAALLATPPQTLSRRHSGALLSYFTSDIAQVEFAVSQAFGSYLRDGLQVLALLGVCLWIDGRLFLLAFVVLPAAVIPVARFARSLKKVAVKSQGGLGQLSELAAEELQNLPVSLAFRTAAAARGRFEQAQGDYLTTMRRSLFLRGAFTPVLETLGIVGAATAIGFGARAVQAEPELGGKLVSFLAAALLLYQPLKALSGTFSQVMQGLGAASRVFELLDLPRAPAGGTALGPLRQALCLSGVRAGYEDDQEVLRGLDLTLRAGERVALVGPSGAGKTTVLSMLLGFIEPRAGEASWDGVPLAQGSRRSLRAQVAWVPQEPVLFSGTVRQNLWLGRPEASEEELWTALRRAHADQVVRALPRGLDEEVGERGAKLSGGQRQRLAIARALVREPSLLLLDEPTSALDAASEREVQAGLAELMAGRTTLIVAHRLSTVRDADRICVLDEGRVVEEGTHAELVARGGRYAVLLAQGELAAA
jgi:ATP-binding cassette, subfamily B, bacterial MsbA